MIVQEVEREIRCKKCNKFLRPNNKSNYCLNHRYLSDYYKKARRKIQKNIRKTKEYKSYQDNYKKKNIEKIRLYSRNYSINRRKTKKYLLYQRKYHREYERKRRMSLRKKGYQYLNSSHI